LKELVEQSQIVINGLRASAAERFGFDHKTVVELNPSVVYCMLNGAGSTGPYRELPMHGIGFDALAGLAPPVIHDDGLPRLPRQSPIGMTAGPMFAAIGVLAALHKASVTGEGQYIEVAEIDAAVLWRAPELDGLLNPIAATGSVPTDQPIRYTYYPTRDDQYVLFMATDDKFWRNFCRGVDRDDLYEPGNSPTGKDPELDARIRHELATIFRTRTRAEWTRFFIDENVAGAPAYLGHDVLEDPHMQTRDLLYEQTYPDDGDLTLLGTCIKVGNSKFRPPATPKPGENTVEVLTGVLGRTPLELTELKRAGVI
jgi:crotonobetainyl-CoA:carnitine CoA-transferase CaiB-like acyl-CoA transferase